MIDVHSPVEVVVLVLRTSNTEHQTDQGEGQMKVFQGASNRLTAASPEL